MPFREITGKHLLVGTSRVKGGVFHRTHSKGPDGPIRVQILYRTYIQGPRHMKGQGEGAVLHGPSRCVAGPPIKGLTGGPTHQGVTGGPSTAHQGVWGPIKVCGGTARHTRSPRRAHKHIEVVYKGRGGSRGQRYPNRWSKVKTHPGGQVSNRRAEGGLFPRPAAGQRVKTTGQM